MTTKPIEKYLVTKTEINSREVKYVEPKIFNKGILARKYVKNMKAVNEKYLIQEIYVIE
jgi:hypothetical protein